MLIFEGEGEKLIWIFALPANNNNNNNNNSNSCNNTLKTAQPLVEGRHRVFLRSKLCWLTFPEEPELSRVRDWQQHRRLQRQQQQQQLQNPLPRWNLQLFCSWLVWCQCYKTFFLLTVTPGKWANMYGPGKPLQPNLMLEGKASGLFLQNVHMGPY